MRKLSSILGSGFTFSLLLLCACKRENQVVDRIAQPDSAFLSITNASPSISNLLFYENNAFISLPDSPFSFGSTTSGSYLINSGNALNPQIQEIPYLKIPAGYVQLGFASTSPQAYFYTNTYLESGSNYSIFITDSITHGQAQYVLLNDQPVSVDSAHGQIRFLNLSPDAPALDVYAFVNAGPNGTKIFSNCGYILSDPTSVLNAQAFTPIKAGAYYMVATIAGTYNAVLDGGLIVPSKGVVTIYVKGFFSGSGDTLANVGVISYQEQ